MLSFSKTTFLNLMLRIEEILQMFMSLKEYFGLVKCSLKDLFESLLRKI